MLLRQRVILGLCCLVLCVSTVTRWGLGVGLSAYAAPRDPTIEITLLLDKPQVVPGEAVNLEELIPASMEAHVTGIQHDILRIGYYDRELGKLVNLHGPPFSHVSPRKLFDDLPEGRAVPHGILFDIRTPRHKGIEFTCRPNRVGIFLITARWYLRNRGERIASNPVVLAVQPPVNASGRPVVKPEWLAEEGWERSGGGHIEIREKR